MDAAEMFADEESAEKWFISVRWPDGVECPVCKSKDIQVRENRKPMPYWCGSCREYFSVKSHSVMHRSKLPLRTWGMAIYLMTTHLRGVSSMKLARDLGIKQATAWHLAHRIRRAYAGGAAGGHANFFGPVEVDETFVGGRQRNRHGEQRYYWREQRGKVGPDGVTRYWGSMVAVAGVKDRRTNRVSAAVVPNVEHPTLRKFVISQTDESTTVYTDDARAYNHLPRAHESVNHSEHEYVRDDVHTNGIESFWASLKRSFKGTYYHWSEKHLPRYLAEHCGRHNSRSEDTVEQMRRIVRGMHRRHLSYARLVAGQ